MARGNWCGILAWKQHQRPHGPGFRILLTLSLIGNGSESLYNSDPDSVGNAWRGRGLLTGGCDPCPDPFAAAAPAFSGYAGGSKNSEAPYYRICGRPSIRRSHTAHCNTCVYWAMGSKTSTIVSLLKTFPNGRRRRLQPLARLLLQPLLRLPSILLLGDRSRWRDDRPTRAKSFAAAGAMIVLRGESRMSISRCFYWHTIQFWASIAKEKQITFCAQPTTIIHAKGCQGSVEP